MWLSKAPWLNVTVGFTPAFNFAIVPESESINSVTASFSFSEDFAYTCCLTASTKPELSLGSLGACPISICFCVPDMLNIAEAGMSEPGTWTSWRAAVTLRCAVSRPSASSPNALFDAVPMTALSAFMVG